MIFMGVGEHEAEQVAALRHQEADVRHDEIDAGQVVAAERDAEIDRDPLPALRVAEAVDRQIHADLADPAERRKHQLFAPAGHQGYRFAVASQLIASLRMK